MNDHKAVEALIDQLVIVRGFSSQDSLDLKIELMSFVLEYLKHARRNKGEEVSFEKFVQCGLHTDGNKLVISAPQNVRDPGTGAASIQFQAPLLMFLLLNHRERYQVLDIIELFIEQMRDQLSLLDFKKTKTGVTRCFTNTRFAAHVLRDYGLLKFTRREAFKTWELSLAGFLVAADVLKKRSREKNPWHLHVSEKEANFDLMQEIRLACNEINTFDALVTRLAFICKPDVEIFKTFEPALEQAFGLLQKYWRLLSDHTKTREERRAQSLELIKRLEQEVLGDRFYEELSRCIQINDLLRRTLQT